MAAVDVEAIRAAHPIADTVARSGVTLETRTHGYLCICPFCKYGDDRDRPIMSVYPTSGRFKCHYGPCSSNAPSKGNPNGGGDVIRYIELFAHLSFRDAAFRLQQGHALAGIATGANLPAEPPTPRAAFTTSPERAYAINQLAWDYFTTPDLVLSAEQYLVADRGINVSLIRVANRGQPVAGYAPNDWDSLARHLIERGIKEQELFDTGLARVNTAGRLTDTFRGRIIFPVRAGAGRISGFIGRDVLLTEPSRQAAFAAARAAAAAGGKAKYVPAKYINSPDTPTFSKSDFLYRTTHHTLDHDATVVVVEGVMDALAIAAAAAEGGQLSRFAPVTESGCAGSLRNVARALAIHAAPPVICLDGDTAGTAGNQRWAAHAATLHRPVLITDLPGCDPAEWIAEHGADGLAAFDPSGFLDVSSNEVRPHLAAAELVRHHFARGDATPRAVLDSLATVAAALGKGSATARFIELAEEEINRLGRNPNGTFRHAVTRAIDAEVHAAQTDEHSRRARADADPGPCLQVHRLDLAT